MPTQTFQRLVGTLLQPPLPVDTKPHWPYPLPVAEMIARYGLRPLTSVEQQHFPGLRLVLRIDKVRLTRPPMAVLRARAGWVVWLAETYPSCYLVRLPGGATLPVPYSEMKWTAVAEDEPVTTLTAAKVIEQQHRWRTAVLPGIRQSLRL